MKTTYAFLFLILLFVGNSVNATNTLTETNTPIYTNHVTTTNNTLLCNLCEISVDLINFEMKFTNFTLQTIGEVVEILCYLIGGHNVGDGCKVIVDHIDQIINDLAKGMNSTQVCDSLSLCNTTSNNLGSQLYRHSGRSSESTNT